MSVSPILIRLCVERGEGPRKMQRRSSALMSPGGPQQAAVIGDRSQPLMTWELRDRSQLGTKPFPGTDGGAGGGSGPTLGAALR